MKPSKWVSPSGKVHHRRLRFYTHLALSQQVESKPGELTTLCGSRAPLAMAAPDAEVDCGICLKAANTGAHLEVPKPAGGGSAYGHGPAVAAKLAQWVSEARAEVELELLEKNRPVRPMHCVHCDATKRAVGVWDQILGTTPGTVCCWTSEYRTLSVPRASGPSTARGGESNGESGNQGGPRAQEVPQRPSPR